MWNEINAFMNAQPMGLRLLILFAFFWVVSAGLSRVWSIAAPKHSEGGKATRHQLVKEGEEQ